MSSPLVLMSWFWSFGLTQIQVVNMLSILHLQVYVYEKSTLIGSLFQKLYHIWMFYLPCFSTVKI